MGMNDINSLSHIKWNCKYHIVIAPKYRRKLFYYEKRAAIGKILRQFCEWKGVTVIAAEACSDLKYKFRNQEFWCRGYYVDTVGKNES